VRDVRRILLRGKPIAVVGGGDSAMEESKFLSRYCEQSVSDSPPKRISGFKIMIDRVRLNEKVEFVTPYVVEEIASPEGLVRGVKLRNPKPE